MVFIILRTIYSRIIESNFWKDHCIYLPAMLGWFVLSASLSSYNKIVFGSDHFHFPFPLMMTSVHFACQWIFSYCLTNVPPPTSSHSERPSFRSLRHSFGGYQIKSMNWCTFLSLAIPCGLCTSLDVGLSNLSLVRISITFYTMVKSSAPIFVLASAYIFGLTRITPSLIMVVLTICAGEVLTVLGEPQFELIGFLLCLFAAIMSGLRWTVVQFILNKIDPPLKSTLATMRLLSPVMFCFMFACALMLERPWTLKSGVDDDDGIIFDVHYVIWSVILALLGASLAISMIMCEYYLILHSSAIVLMIGGVLKEMVTILCGVIFFGNTINVINLIGCLIVFFGVISYKLSIYVEKLEKECELIESDEADRRESDDDFSYGSQSDSESDGENNLFIIDDEKDTYEDGKRLEIT